MFDTWQEILTTMRKNKLRTILTGFSISWGIFLLIILLASGNGLRNGVMSNFGDRAKNMVSVYPGYTSKAYAGYQRGRQIKFDYQDIEMLENRTTNVDKVTSTVYMSGLFSYKNQYGNYQIQGLTPIALITEGIKIMPGKGRFINDLDIQERRKVVVLEKKHVDELFGQENPIGQYINISQLRFLIIGVYEHRNPNRDAQAFIPLTSATAIYSLYYYNKLQFTVNNLETTEANNDYKKMLRKQFAALHEFSADDESAIWIWSNMEEFVQAMGIFNSITFFLWIIGISTLVVGVVGVSNIMLITVKERTREFGVRKALGASPYSILRLILLESLVITTIFGYIGMVAGIGLTELFNSALSAGGGQSDMTLFKNPTIDTSIALGAMLLLVISGLIAGYIPALKAVKVRPIEALRYE